MFGIKNTARQIVNTTTKLYQHPHVANTLNKVMRVGQNVLPVLVGIVMSEIASNLITATSRTKYFLYCFTCGATAGITNTSFISCATGYLFIR